VVVIKTAKGNGAAMSLATRLDHPFGAHKARLVFHRYGNTYFLAEVWGPGNDGRQLPTTSQEREMAARIRDSNASVVAALR
jgi:hypothetical protein